MTELVFLDPEGAEPFTTSKIIAENTGLQHHSVTRSLRDYPEDFEAFGPLEFMDLKSINPKGGRPDRIYRLNEEQATLLFTYLKNTPIVRAFKKELVRQFYLMRKMITSQQLARAALKPARRELTDVIKETNPGLWTYKHYMDLCYKAAVGMSAKQIREAYGAPKNANATDLLPPAQQAAVLEVTYKAAVLRELGVPYDQTKAILEAYGVTRVPQAAGCSQAKGLAA